uniref:Uncharacterized protein n=1 Tax=Tanacetum cinerariifolium TaxID=118510 RepID=A0A699IUI9_TANCI|nr:hypothetical protein [Tanacetum cinerariifolium]
MLSRISFHVLYGRPFKTLCFFNYALMIRQDYDITSSLGRGALQVESRLAEHKDLIKKEKEGIDSKLTGFQTASKDLDSLLENQILDQNKEGLGYNDVPPPPTQIYSSPKKDMSWTGLPEFKDDTITDYSRPAPTIESSPNNAQNRNPSVTEEASPVPSHLNLSLRGCKITSKGSIKTGKLEFKNNVLFTDSECIVLGQNFKLSDDDNVLLRTPRQHNMYSIDLNNIVPHKDLTCLVAKASADKWKFKAKGDECYFIGYSMSSKAFRVFNKRTRRVEENLHVEFLENKAIENGAGPNWLFDIDSLTKSMNYMPVDARTNSTNLSGTKDATSQEMKKDVSSLRYIALPNWFHDAVLESSSSKPQDDCSTDVPESSGNFNPTTTSTNSSADQLETLTVETPIPTISSPVPTSCFTDSLDPSSDTRLISKRVANQVETSSLDNILTLTKRFKDILGVTTKSTNSDGVEAHMDVKSACLYDTIDEEVYVMQPPRFQDLEFLAKVYKVEKAMGTIDQTLFIRTQRGDFILVQVYINDIISGSSNPQLCRGFEALMHEKFQMSAVGKLNFFLGLQVLQKEDGIFLSQDKYVGDIFKNLDIQMLDHQILPWTRRILEEKTELEKM